MISPDKVVTKAEYNSAGEPTRITDGAGQVTKMTYDGAGRVVRTTAPDGTYSTAAYNLAGQQFSATDYSAAGVLLRNESQRFDVSGNLVAFTDARKATKTFGYDALDRLVTQRESVGPSQTITTEFGYDLTGRQTRFTDGRGNKFITTYNTWGLPESQIEPATTSTPNTADRTFTMTYDKGGRLTRVDSPGGVTVTSEYDSMGRLRKSSGTGAQAVTTDKTYTYDKAGRMESFAGSAGTNQIAYDDRGLVTSITGVSGNSSYTYNGDGALTSRTDAAGTTSYSYDTAGRAQKVENAAAGVNMTYSYDTMSRVEKINYPGSVRTFGYNDLQQLTSDELRNAAGATVAKIDYEWNLNDSLTKKTTTGFNGASTNTYEYDLANRLTLWDNGTTPVVYAYDKSGNRVQAGTTTFTYDQRNQLVSDSSGTTYQYTPRGTLLSTTSGGQTVITETDAFNQVKVQGTKTGGTTSYSYDGLGRMLQTGVSYTGLGNDVAADGSTVYVRDVAGSLVAVASGSTKRHAWTDAHTDVVGEFTDTGAMLAGSVSYDPWGKVLAAGGMVGKLGYQQEWTDQTAGKVNMWSRWYDPETAAFDTRDTANNSPTPTSGSANRFAYAEGDPLSNTDITGNAVDGKCGEYDYACAVRKFQAAMDVYNDAMEQRDRDMQAAGAQIAAQEAEFQRAERESQTSLLDILLQVGIGTLLDIIGYTALQGCLGGSLWDCADLASNALGPIKAIKLGRSLFRAAERAFDGYRAWKRIVDGAQSAMRRASDAINAGRKLLNDVMKKVPKKPKPPKKKKKPAAKKKPKPKPKVERKPKPSAQAKPQKPKAEPKKETAPTKQAKPQKPAPTNKEPKKENRRAEEQDSGPSSAEAGQDPADLSSCQKKHSFDPDTLVLMADGTTRRISEVAIGDEVRATDPQTGKDGAREVTVLHANRDRELTDVTVSDRPADDTAAGRKPINEGNGERSTRGPTTSVLKTTAHHPFWDVTTGAWIDAAELVVGESTLVGPRRADPIRHRGPQLHRLRGDARPHRRRHPHVLCDRRRRAGPRTQQQWHRRRLRPRYRHGVSGGRCWK
ncbi:RHS repeat-associated core domain-containing protein [Plantactinospora sp. DSM 117369]